MPGLQVQGWESTYSAQAVLTPPPFNALVTSARSTSPAAAQHKKKEKEKPQRHHLIFKQEHQINQRCAPFSCVRSSKRTRQQKCGSITDLHARREPVSHSTADMGHFPLATRHCLTSRQLKVALTELHGSFPPPK